MAPSWSSMFKIGARVRPECADFELEHWWSNLNLLGWASLTFNANYSWTSVLPATLIKYPPELPQFLLPHIPTQTLNGRRLIPARVAAPLEGYDQGFDWPWSRWRINLWIWRAFRVSKISRPNPNWLWRPPFGVFRGLPFARGNPWNTVPFGMFLLSIVFRVSTISSSIPGIYHW